MAAISEKAESKGALMPVYEFECKNCGNKFETLIRSHDPGNIRCPVCGSRRVPRIASIFSCFGVQLTKRLRMEAEDGLKREKKY